MSAATPRAGTGQRKSCESTSCAAVRLSASRAMAMQAAARIMALFCRGALQVCAGACRGLGESVHLSALAVRAAPAVSLCWVL